MVTEERLSDLLVSPCEDLDFEVKNWLDLQNSNEDKATFAKAALALANHGGGFIALGLVETDTGIIESEGRPPTLDGYNQDLINGIVHSYSDPSFHCSVHFVENPNAAIYPIVVVPGGHRAPIRARRAGPHGNIVQNNGIYIRKPGPHKIEGVGAGFVPPAWRSDFAEEIQAVSTVDAKNMTRKMAKEEALFCGTSSGANVVAALRIAQRIGPGKTVVTVACDTGLKYLSTDLFSV